MHLDFAKLPFEGCVYMHSVKPTMLYKMGGKALHAGDQSENSRDRFSKKHTNTEKDGDRHYQNEEDNSFRSLCRLEDTSATIRYWQAIQLWGGEKQTEQGICGPSLEKTPYPRRKLKLKTFKI
jgi:hypothetical protein